MTRLRKGNLAAALSNPCVFTYGWPSGQNSEPNVKAQWLMDSTSGSGIDVVNDIEIGEPYPNPPLLQYTLGAPLPYHCLSPGIKFGPDGGQFLYKGTPTVELNIGGTEHLVVEWWGYWEVGNTKRGAPFRLISDSGAGKVVGVTMLTGSEDVEVFFKADDGTQVTTSATVAGFKNGEITKWRFVVNKGGNMFLERNSQTVVSIAASALSGKAFTCNELAIGGTTGDAWQGGIFELRVSIGTDVLNNNSGGVGGG